MTLILPDTQLNLNIKTKAKLLYLAINFVHVLFFKDFLCIKTNERVV